MKLTDGTRKKLEQYFNCPVLDIYSMTECRMVAVAENQRHRAIRPDLYLEVFDKDHDILLSYGEIGELVVTGGSNPFLPLVRYRTGDFCKLEMEKGIPFLIDLEARSPVPLYNKNGKLINNIDVSREMSTYPLTGFTLHQHKNLHLVFTGWSEEDLALEVEDSLKEMFGEDMPVTVSIKSTNNDKVYKTVTYTSDVDLQRFC
jgi:phenylacetate-CoA ligase